MRNLAILLAFISGVLLMFQPVEAQNPLFEEILRLPLSGLCQVALSPEGDQIAVKRFTDAQERIMELALYATQSGERLAVLHTAVSGCPTYPISEYGDINTLDWQAQTLVAAFGSRVIVWDTSDSFRQKYILEGDLFALSARASLLAIRTPTDLVLYNLESGQVLTRDSIERLFRYAYPIRYMAWSPSDQRLLVADGSELGLVDIQEGAFVLPQPLWEGGSWFDMLDWFDESRVLTHGGGRVVLWEVNSSRILGELWLANCALKLSPNRHWLVGFKADYSPDFSSNVPLEPAVEIYTFPEGRLVTRLPHELQDRLSNSCIQLTFSANGKYLAAIVDRDKPTLHIWARAE